MEREGSIDEFARLADEAIVSGDDEDGDEEE